MLFLYVICLLSHTETAWFYDVQSRQTFTDFVYAFLSNYKPFFVLRTTYLTADMIFVNSL